MSDDVKDFILKCCMKDPKERLGHESADQIFDHPWFANSEITMEQIANREVTYFKREPAFSSNEDVSAFDSSFTNRDPVIPELNQSE